MEKENISVYVDTLIGDLTMDILRVTSDINQLQKMFANVALGERYAEDFVSALTKLFAKINEFEATK